jgi:hypothetical protein
MEGIKDCQDPYSSQDPYNETIKLLTAASDRELERNNSIDDRPKEDSNVTSAL